MCDLKLLCGQVTVCLYISLVVTLISLQLCFQTFIVTFLSHVSEPSPGLWECVCVCVCVSWPPRGCLHWPCIWAPPPGAEWTSCCPKPWWGGIMPVMCDTPPCCEDTDTEEKKTHQQQQQTEWLQSLDNQWDILLQAASAKAPCAALFYRLLLAEEEAAELGIGYWVRQAQDGALRRGLAALGHLVGWSAADWRLLVRRSGRSHGHLRGRTGLRFGHGTFQKERSIIYSVITQLKTKVYSTGNI